MSEEFNRILDEISAFSIPKQMERFLLRERRPFPSEQSLSYYSYCYERGFELLAEAARAELRGGVNLQLPLFYMARHSIELSIKWALAEFSEFTGQQSAECGHNLIKLWRELNQQFDLADMPDEYEWGEHCRRLVEHIHQIDPTGEAFRYPHRNNGERFDYTHVELDGVIKAHHHITSYCGASLDMLAHGRG